MVYNLYSKGEVCNLNICCNKAEWMPERGRTMRGPEIMRAIDEQVGHEHRFVRWWRKEEDFLDYDLINRFIENHKMDEEIGGIDLLTMDDMWGELKRVGGKRVRLVHSPSGDIVEWEHEGRGGVERSVCPFTPESLISIYDVETHGNPVDS